MSNIGKKIYGFCNGFFGDDYENKRIEAEGEDWIVARPYREDAEAVLASFISREEKESYLEKWSNPKEE